MTNQKAHTVCHMRGLRYADVTVTAKLDLGGNMPTGTLHDTHQTHDHVHGDSCGHAASAHAGHVDHLHDGHRHAAHQGHYDEH